MDFQRLAWYAINLLYLLFAYLELLSIICFTTPTPSLHTFPALLTFTPDLDFDTLDNNDTGRRVDIHLSDTLCVAVDTGVMKRG